jgi:thiosulfate dehydrogenase
MKPRAHTRFPEIMPQRVECLPARHGARRMLVPLVLCAALSPLPVASVDTPTVPLRAPAADSIPSGQLGASIRLGQSIITDTQTNAKDYVGNGLACVSCHLDGGRTAYAAPLVGLIGVFPEYRARRGRVESLEERINDCFLRSMNGKALPPDSREMIGILSYIAWLSQGVPTGTEVAGRGFRDIKAPSPPDAVRGKSLYAQKCAVCHGADGQGTRGAGNAFIFPPLWGAQSFNAGAGMARLTVAAAFVQSNMPVGNAGSLTDQEAYDIAAYFTAQPKPAFTGSVRDWPKGDRPADAR